MISAVNELTTYNEDAWQEYLERICLYEIFKDLVQKYKERPGLLKSLIRYIVWAYSKDSEKIVLGGDWLQTKKRIFEDADLPLNEDVLKEVVHLENETILTTIKKWLEYQDEDTWRELCMLQDLRIEMQVSANGSILKSTGEQDFDQKFKNAKYSIELYNMIKDTQSKLLQNDPKMKDAIQEAKRAIKKDTLSPGMFSK